MNVRKAILKHMCLFFVTFLGFPVYVYFSVLY